MKANTIIVQCDAPECKWSQKAKIDNAAVWHNAKCPKCGHAPVISDKDLAIIKVTIALRDAGLAFIGGKKKPAIPHLEVRIDTKGLRGHDD